MTPVLQPAERRPQGTERRRRLLRRALPIGAMAAVAFVAGAIAGAPSTDLDAAKRFVAAWEHGDYATMHEQLTDESASRYSLSSFTAAYDDAAKAATVTRIITGDVTRGQDATGGTAAVVPVTLRTNAFGTLNGQLVMPLAGGRVAWDPTLVFPGLKTGETLVKQTRVPQRAAILASDGTALAEGPASARTSPLGASASAVAGAMGAPSARERTKLQHLGFPAGTEIGASGLERAFNDRLLGRPGGALLIQGPTGSTVVAQTSPVPGKPVHTTIDPNLQQAAVAALGSTFGGVAALDPSTGDVLAVAGIAFSSPQPPGSTFKLITTTAALDAGIVKTTDTFPYQSGTVVGGRQIANANGEVCGGTFVQAFAQSCNSVFVPLGPKLGSDRLVGMAEKYGFNSPPSLYDRAALDAVGIPPSSLPQHIGTDLDLGVSAIGQGRVLATPLEMASVAQTIANGGKREPTSIVKDGALKPDQKPVRVTSTQTADTMRNLMIGVVTSGTGTAAAIPGITVAGKTGTAELGPATTVPPGTNPADVKQRVDAWFTCFAPATDPKLVVAALVTDASGAGGSIAAPIARQVLASGLGVG
ncbi:MAG: penicillin-binding protein [Solirubrobacterales bacterium]|nr:penicillin-binding protein [Solirubrobacterales bacterium]